MGIFAQYGVVFVRIASIITTQVRLLPRLMIHLGRPDLLTVRSIFFNFFIPARTLILKVEVLYTV